MNQMQSPGSDAIERGQPEVVRCQVPHLLERVEQSSPKWEGRNRRPSVLQLLIPNEKARNGRFFARKPFRRASGHAIHTATAVQRAESAVAPRLRARSGWIEGGGSRPSGSRKAIERERVRMIPSRPPESPGRLGAASRRPLRGRPCRVTSTQARGATGRAPRTWGRSTPPRGP
jgi:hypothetical protein